LLRRDNITITILVRKIFNWGWITGSEVWSIVIMEGSMMVLRHGVGERVESLQLDHEEAGKERHWTWLH